VSARAVKGRADVEGTEGPEGKVRGTPIRVTVAEVSATAALWDVPRATGGNAHMSIRQSGSARRRHRLVQRACVMLSAMVAVTVFGVWPLTANADVQPSPPQQPLVGLGSNGPCGTSLFTERNPAASDQVITVISPTGTAATPLVGGHCNDAKRPVVVVVHGLLAGIDAQILGFSLLYWGIINHEVSQGNVVIFATWNTLSLDILGSYQQEDASITTAATVAPRGDLSRLGIIGHSLGGGAVPYLAQQAVARGWGSRALWLQSLAPAWMFGVGTGPITVPPSTRAEVVNFDDDNFVDARIGIDMFQSLTVPLDHKKHLEVRSETRGSVTLDATHLAPNSLLSPDDAIKFFGIYRGADAFESCSLLHHNCDADLSWMGRWSDGQRVTPAISSDHPVDIGPPATALSFLFFNGECTTPFNPRASDCGP
jgi:hypothetical protein